LTPAHGFAPQLLIWASSAFRENGVLMVDWTPRVPWLVWLACSDCKEQLLGNRAAAHPAAIMQLLARLTAAVESLAGSCGESYLCWTCE